MKSLEFQQKMSFLTNQKEVFGLNNFHKNIMELTGFESIKSFKEFIRCILYGSKILEKGKNKQNLIVASELKSALKDEARAYHAGGKAEKLFFNITDSETAGLTSNSELRSELYTIMVKTLKKEEKRAFMKWIIQMLGVTPSYKIEEKSIKLYNKVLNTIKKEQ